MRDSDSLTTRRVSLAAGGVAVCLAAAVATTIAAAPAQKGGKAVKPPSTTYTGVTATFRSDSLDGIRGDGQPYVGGTSTTEGAFLVRSGTYDDFRLKLDGSSGRRLTLDFSTQMVAPPDPCGGTKRRPIRCRMNFVSVDVTRMLLIDQGLLVRPVNADGTELAGGFRAIAEGTTVPATLKLNFPDPAGSTLWYTLRYNSEYFAYPGSALVRVTRTGQDTWTIEAGGLLDAADNGWAGLLGSTDGSSNKTYEGVYLMPFSITITVVQ